MNRAIAMLIIGLVFGGGIGFVIAAANGVTLDGHDHMTDHATHSTDADHSAHKHGEPIKLEAGALAPELVIETFADPVSGWNLYIQVKNFKFSPQNSGRQHQDGEGHAHVYIDDVKWGRVYGEWVHLNLDTSTAVELKVTLTSNDHRPLHVGEDPLEAVLRLGSSGG